MKKNTSNKRKIFKGIMETKKNEKSRECRPFKCLSSAHLFRLSLGEKEFGRARSGNKTQRRCNMWGIALKP